MMRPKTIMKRARKVLAANKGYQEMKAWHDKTAKKLTHWGQAESEEELIFMWDDGTVVMSNEGSVTLTTEPYGELAYGLDKDFKKAGLFVEPYDGGTFHITEGWEK